MQFHPFSVSSLVCSGEGGRGGDETKKNAEVSSPLINLELEVGCGLVGKSSFVFKQEEEENILFTDAQFQELYLQVVIFKYLSSGLSVPFHLVLPIWNSFSISSACGFSPPLFVHGSTMDPEPGRCRRTDGKKWRCYGSVVPDQKYCERHMHRGSQRSRKLVEASNNHIVKSNKEDLPSDKRSRSSTLYSRTSVSNGRLSVPVSTTLDLTPPSATAEADFTNISYKSNSECSSSINATQLNSSTAIISSLLKAQAFKNNNTRNVSSWNHSLGNNKSGKPSFVAAGLGVSPKSVLQGDTGYGNSSFDNKTGGTQNEALRCRRTDGKRWRCSRVVVPYKKYCENHLHRGSKKAATTTAAAGVAGASCVQKKPNMVKNYNRVLDTNLSISIVPNPPQNLENDSSISSSSDATTVSDENICHFHTL